MVPHLKSKRQQVASYLPFWERLCMPPMLSLGWQRL